MSKEPISRREFLSPFDKKEEDNGKETGDILFNQYSRKEFNGRNNYSNANTTNKYFNPQRAELGVNSTLAPYNGVWTEWEVLHLLRRTNFGFKKSDVDALLAKTMSDAVDAILNVDNTPPSPVNWYDKIMTDENSLPYGADWTNDAFSTNTVGQNSNNYRSLGLMHWNLGLSLNQDITIREKMVWFWYHFIPIDFDTIYKSANKYVQTNSARICYQYIKMFRDASIGNFKTLITNMATQPAMMFYLNNQANTKTAPDENFAREVMELFTLGKDPLSQYTQSDVVEAAKVLTGWRVINLNLNTTTTQFDSTVHNTGIKTFSSFFNNAVITNTGASELTSFIDMIFAKQQVVSEYVCRRLYRFFVYYDIDTTIESNIITPLAQTLVASNWDMKPVLSQLLKSEHFFDLANRGVYIKAPFDVVIGSLKTFNINLTIPDTTNYQAQYKLWEHFNTSYLSQMEQVMGDIPNVAGWKAFYQNPSFHEYWINSNTIQKRFLFLQKIVNGYTQTNNGASTVIKIDVIAWIQQFPNSICQDPDLLTAECIKYLLPVDLSATQKDSIKTSSLLSGQSTNSYWTDAWNNYIQNPTNISFKNIVESRLKTLLATLVQLAEYQLM